MARETYAIQAFLRGDSGFNLTINNLNDSFKMNLYTNNYVYYGLRGNQQQLALEYAPVLGNLTMSSLLFPTGGQFNIIDLVYNGALWVALFNNSSAPLASSGIAYKSLGEDWKLALGGPFPLNVYTVQGGLKTAYNGTYWLAVGFAANNYGFLNNSRVGSIWRSNDGITWFNISSDSLGFRVAATDLKWNGSYWLITGSDYQTFASRDNFVVKYDGQSLTRITSSGLSSNFDGTSIEWNDDDKIWVLMGGVNNYNEIVSNDGINNPTIFTKSDAASSWTQATLLYGSISLAKQLRYNNLKYVLTTDDQKVFISTTNNVETLASNVITTRRTTSITYLKTTSSWLISGTALDLPELYSILGTTVTRVSVTNTTATQIFCVGTTDIDTRLWTTSLPESQYALYQTIDAQLQHGPQSPQEFTNNLQDALGQNSTVGIFLDSYDPSNPAMLHVQKLEWTFTLPIKYVTFTNRFGRPISNAFAATFGLYQNAIAKSEYVVTNSSFYSPSPVILSQPVTWTFRKPGIAGLADTDGLFRLESSGVTFSLGPGQNEFYAPTHNVTFYGLFSGPNNFATLSGVFNITTSEIVGQPEPTYSNKINSVDMTILFEDDTSTPLEDLDPLNTSFVTWTIDSDSITATFPNFNIRDTYEDFTISFNMLSQTGDVLGTFEFRTTYYSSQKYTERNSPIFAQFSAGGSSSMDITSIGAGGGTYNTNTFTKFSGGNSCRVFHDIDLNTGITTLFANVGSRGTNFLNNGATGGQSTRVSLNSKTLCDVGGGGGGSIGAVGGSAGSGSIISPTPTPPGENFLHGGRPSVFGFVESSQGTIYNLRPGGSGGFGSVKVQGLIRPTLQSGTGTQSNKDIDFFGAGSAGETAFLTTADSDSTINVDFAVLENINASGPYTLCQTTSIIQEIFPESYAQIILDTVMPEIAVNPTYDNEVYFGTSVGQLNKGTPRPLDIGVTSYLSLGPSDEFLPFTQCPNCRPIDDATNGTNISLVFKSLVIYDDGQIIYSKIKDYIGTAFYSPGFKTYVTNLRVGSSESASGPNNRYNCIYLSFQDTLPNTAGPFYWDIPGGFLNGNIVKCDGLVNGLRGSVPFQNDDFTSRIYAAIENLSIPLSASGPQNPIGPTRVLPGTDNYASIIWPSNNLRVDFFARETNGPNSIVNGHFEEFEYAGSTTSFTIPIWCTRIRIMTYGAAASSSSVRYKGSHGSLVTGTFQFLAETTLYFQIGLGGGRQGAFAGGSGVGPLGGGSTGVFTDINCDDCIQGAAGGGAGSTNKAGISELDTSWSTYDGRVGQSLSGYVGESSLVGGPGGSGFPGGSSGRRGYAGAGGLSLVPPNGSVQLGLQGTIFGVPAPNGKIVLQLF
jgi:hypothetical protein